MAESGDRSRSAGDRNRRQRLQAKRLTARQDFWDVPDEGGRPHRRSRAAQRRRGSR
jgi:hypothetical protein